MIRKNTIVVIYLFRLLMSPNLMSYESGQYRKICFDIHKNISRHLRSETSFKGGFMYSLPDGGVSFTKYNIKDKSYLPELIKATLEEYEKYDRKVTITITLYSISHEEYREMNILQRNMNSIFKLELKGVR